MKQLVALFLVCRFAFGVTASADGVDIDNLTNDALLSLHNQINLKLFGTALVNGIEIPQGFYEVGIDIPAGSYVITLCGEKFSCNTEIFENLDEAFIFFGSLDSKENNPSSIKISLKEGQLLDVDLGYSQGTITIKAWSAFLAS